MTWRQKDRDEPLLGLYGKNAFYYTKDSEDDIFMIEEFNKNAPKSEQRQRTVVDPKEGPNNIHKLREVKGRQVDVTRAKDNKNLKDKHNKGKDRQPHCKIHNIFHIS